MSLRKSFDSFAPQHKLRNAEEAYVQAVYRLRSAEEAYEPVSYTHLTLPTTPYV